MKRRYAKPRWLIVDAEYRPVLKASEFGEAIQTAAHLDAVVPCAAPYHVVRVPMASLKRSAA